jgi:hypothetical protein
MKFLYQLDDLNKFWIQTTNTRFIWETNLLDLNTRFTNCFLHERSKIIIFAVGKLPFGVQNSAQTSYRYLISSTRRLLSWLSFKLAKPLIDGYMIQSIKNVGRPDLDPLGRVLLYSIPQTTNNVSRWFVNCLYWIKEVNKFWRCATSQSGFCKSSKLSVKETILSIQGVKHCVSFRII